MSLILLAAVSKAVVTGALSGSLGGAAGIGASHLFDSPPKKYGVGIIVGILVGVLVGKIVQHTP